MIPTADLSDSDPAARVMAPAFRDYGGVPAFYGLVTTVRCFEDNSLVRDTVAEPGAGRVLVVDGGGSLQCALLGDRLAADAADNGWAGVVVNGCVRDAAQLAGMPLGVKALATSPRRSVRRGIGDRDVDVTMAGVTVSPGDWLYADPDGIVVVADAPHPADP